MKPKYKAKDVTNEEKTYEKMFQTCPTITETPQFNVDELEKFKVTEKEIMEAYKKHSESIIKEEHNNFMKGLFTGAFIIAIIITLFSTIIYVLS